jgi:hypothetical protein
MKEFNRYCLLVMAYLNGFFGWALVNVQSLMQEVFSKALGDLPLPSITWLVYDFHWWPYGVAVLCCAGCLTAVLTDTKPSVLRHGIIAILFLELIAMFITVVGYTVPWLMTIVMVGSE